MTGEERDWMTSHLLAAFLGTHRDNDIKVRIRGTLVPIADVSYYSDADCIVLELVDGADLDIALRPDVTPEGP